MTPSPSPVAAVLAELDDLLAKATPGPWALYPGCDDEILGEFKPASEAGGDNDEFAGIDVAQCRTPIGGSMHGDHEAETANASLIVAMHTALPRLLAAIRAVDELHHPIRGRDDDDIDWCAACTTGWPCATSAALAAVDVAEATK